MTKTYSGLLSYVAHLVMWFSLLSAPATVAQTNSNSGRLNEQAVRLYNAGRYLEAEQYARRALDAEELRSGRQSREITPLLENLATIYRKQRRHDAAAPLLKRSYEITRQSLSADHPDVGSLLYSIALNFVSMENRPPEAEHYFRLLLSFEENTRGPSSKSIAYPTMLLVAFYKERNRLSEAEPLARRALDTFENDEQPDDGPILSVLLDALTEYYIVEKRFSDAESFAVRALRIEEKEHGADHLYTARALNFLGVIYHGLGRYKDAVAAHSRALTIREASQPVNLPDVAVTFNNLAEAYLSLERYLDAEGLLRRSLQILQNENPANSFRVNNLLVKLGGALMNLDKHEEAERYFIEAVAAREKAAGPGDRTALEGRNGLSCLYGKLDRHAEAETNALFGLDAAEKAFGAEDRLVGALANCLALSYNYSGRSKEALGLYERALAIVHKQYGERHPAYATLLNNLAGAYLEQGRFDDAERYYLRALAIRESILGSDHASVAESLNNIAVLYMMLDRYPEAEAFGRRALAIIENGRGHVHSSMSHIVYNQAILSERQGKLADAERLHRRALSLTKSAFGTKHVRAAQRSGALGELLKAEGKLDQAAEFLEESLYYIRLKLGIDNPRTVRAMVHLAELYVLNGRLSEAQALFREAGATKPADLKEFPIYFGTNRKLSAKGGGYFNNERNGTNLTFGIIKVLVSTPIAGSQRREFSQLREAPTLGRLLIKERWIEDHVDLVRAARSRLLNSRNYLGQTLVFVHGFNVSFDNAARRAAQIAYDLDFDGPVFLFSWPSRGSASPFAYIDDRESAQLSSDALRAFLVNAVAPTNSIRIHMLAHSMGNVTLNEALQGMSDENLDKFNFGELIHASPDLDIDLFQRTQSRLLARGAQSTIYGSSTDIPLGTAGWARGRNPLGYIPAKGPDRIVAGSDLIDVSGASSEVFSLNHDIYANSADIMSDIKALLLTQKRPPDLRTKKLKKLTIDAGTYWRFEK